MILAPHLTPKVANSVAKRPAQVLHDQGDGCGVVPGSAGQRGRRVAV
jgi:hypothetical protein